MTVRDHVARRNAGGPTFSVLPSRVLVEVGGVSSLSNVIESSVQTDSVLDNPPATNQEMANVASQLQGIGLSTTSLNNTGVMVAETTSLQSVAKRITDQTDLFSSGAISEVESALKSAGNHQNRTLVGGFRPGMFNFSQDDKDLEAALRNNMASMSLQNPITQAISELQNVISVHVDFSRNTPGPRNRGVDVDSETLDTDSEKSDKPHVGDVLSKLKVPDVWDQGQTGADAIAAVFDTSYSPEFLQSSRVRDTFSGSDVDSAYSAPEEGHGTMTAYSMAGNKEESGLPYNGMAKDAEMLLARVSASDGSMKYIAESWDWLVQHIKDADKPIVSNHSYGVPMCSARGMNLCSTVTAKQARVMNKRDDHQAFYAAGNEALYCGHRLSGVTNGINGINSDPTSLTSGAFRFDLLDAQTYSSHGFGSCTSVSDNPKPDFGCMLPSIVPYGNKEKDMSTGQGGSNGGTSEASPLNAGVATLLASELGHAKQSPIEDLMESTATGVRTTQVNLVRGHDARFGNGQVRPKAAYNKLLEDSSGSGNSESGSMSIFN